MTAARNAPRCSRLAVALLMATLLVSCGLQPQRASSENDWARAGVVLVEPMPPEKLDLLGPVWFYTYHFLGSGLAGHHRLYLITPHYADADLENAVRSNPGQWWLIGNEPNDPFQDNMSPQAYAAFYHRGLAQVCRLDPSARVVPAGIAGADWEWAGAFRESYLDQYGRYPPLDAWNIHNYILEPEHDQLDLEEFQRRVLSFREWMARIGDEQLPLLLTEFGALYHSSASDEEVATYLQEVVGWLESTDHVQHWAWFANRTAGQFNGDLYDQDWQLSRFGEAYAQAVERGLNR